MSEPGSQDQPDDATTDLLIKHVVEGLSPAEQRALEASGSGARRRQEDFERAAAALSLAAPIDTALPASLRARLEQRAAEHVTSMLTQRKPQPPVELKRGAGTSGWGWLAAAACLVLAVLGWVRSPRTPAPAVVQAASPGVVAPPVSTELPPAKPVLTPQEALALLAAKPDAIKVALGPTKDPGAAGASGSVVWDPATQTGFVRIVGLTPNDPAVHQYQLWVFDAERDKRYPVDGGVFNIPAGMSDVVIPINAKLIIRKPAAFAVTVEKPGGVVVSAREHIVVLGAAT